MSVRPLSAASRPPIDVARLDAETASLRRSFDEGVSFRHVSIDGFLDAAVAERARRAFPQLANGQRSIARLLEARSYASDLGRFDPIFDDVFESLGSPPFVAWLRAFTGIPDLEMDRELVGGGLHQGARGSRLHVHADHNTHPRDATRYRRINVLIYLNRDWRPEWGGDLDIYDPTGSRCVERIAPVFNRCFITEVHDRAFHGYRPLRVPATETRKMLAAYFYSREPHTLQTRERHGTTFAHPENETRLEATLFRIRHAILKRLPRIVGLAPQSNRKA